VRFEMVEANLLTVMIEIQKQDIERIRALETELLQLRIRTRHFDFPKDYDRSTYQYGIRYNQNDMQKVILNYLKILDEPIKNEVLIIVLLTKVLDLSEYDLEKTRSGNVRIYSTIRTAVVNLQRQKIIVTKNDKLERGQLILTEKFDKWVEKQDKSSDSSNKRLRDHFPTNKAEAKPFEVIMYDDVTVFKIFELNESVEPEKILIEVVGRVNDFLMQNGYSTILIEDIDMEVGPSYESPDGLFSLSKHGYCDDLVLFIKSYNY